MKIETLVICGIAELEQNKYEGVSHVLSLLDPGTPVVAAVASLPVKAHKTLWFHDILSPEPGKTMPSPADLAEILAFAELARAEMASTPARMLIHCHQGISRSTAAMLAILDGSQPELQDEDQLFAQLRAIRPRAWPNSTMVGWIDDLSGRAGRLSAALARHYAYQLHHLPSLGRLLESVGRGVEVDLGKRTPHQSPPHA